MKLFAEVELRTVSSPMPLVSGAARRHERRAGLAIAHCHGVAESNDGNFCSVIIHLFASNSPSLMLFRVPSLRRISLGVLIVANAFLVSCGSSTNPSSSTPNTTRLKLRAFVTNPLASTSFGTAPVIDVIDALKDELSGAVSLSTAQPGMMAVFPNKRFTLVYGGGGNSISIIDNAQEAVVGSTLTLPGPTESMVVSADNVTGYVAVPTATVAGQDPGVVEVLNLTNNAITATIPVPGARFLAVSHNGNRVLVFGSQPDRITIITPSLIGTSTDPRTVLNPSGCSSSTCPFDHPVWGLFSSDDNTAYILNCGPECGGTTASVAALEVNTNLPGSPLLVNAATIGMLSGSTLYVAGSPPSCPAGATAPACGTLSVIDTASMAVTNPNPIFITDGYHNRMEMGADGQLFIGARACSNGCLSIFDTNPNGKVTLPSDTGDVTGIQPITTRHVVYVCEDGELRIYETTTDKLQANQIDIIGQAVDVKLVD
ncbi:MAG: hypothetical protein DMG88_10655 [Acidobacteria bacterium]|nr:MAG: hypothetical protein DMG88_10655 [Acidobacteriota bacterium]